MGELCGHASSATHRQAGWGLHQRGWSNNAFATLHRRPRHELACIWTDFLSEQRRATDFVETAGREGGKRQPARCLHKTQDKFAIAFMAKNLLHRCIGAHARVHVHFLLRVCMHFDRCCKHHACACVLCTLNRFCEHQRTHLRTRSLQGLHMRSCMRSLFIWCWQTRVEEFS